MASPTNRAGSWTLVHSVTVGRAKSTVSRLFTMQQSFTEFRNLSFTIRVLLLFWTPKYIVAFKSRMHLKTCRWQDTPAARLQTSTLLDGGKTSGNFKNFGRKISGILFCSVRWTCLDHTTRPINSRFFLAMSLS